MTIPVEQALEIGAPARLLDAEAGIDVEGTVIAKEVDLDQRERVRATLGAIPLTSGDAFAELAEREDERVALTPPDHIPLEGATGETLKEWQYPPDPRYMDGSKVDGLPGGAVLPGTVPGSAVVPASIDGTHIGPEQLTMDPLSEEAKEFIRNSGGGNGKVRYGNMDDKMKALFRKLEMYPAADCVMAADPEEGQLTPPIWDTSKHFPSLPSLTQLTHEIDVGLWEFEHYANWTFNSETKTATYFDPANRARSRVRFIIPGDVIRQPPEPRSAPGELMVALSFRVLEIINPHRHGSFSGIQSEFSSGQMYPGGVSFNFPGDSRARRIGTSLPTNYRTQWFDKQGKYGAVVLFPEASACDLGDVPPTLGPDLIANGIFDVPSVGGEPGAPWSRQGFGWLFQDPDSGASLGQAEFTLPAGSGQSGSIVQAIELEPGSIYRLTFDVTRRITGRVKGDVGGSHAPLVQTTGAKSFDVTAGARADVRFHGEVTRIGFGASEGADLAIDNVTLKKIIYPTTAADRYILEIWIAAQGVTITDPVIRLAGRRPDPEYRALELVTPTGDWVPSIAVEPEQEEEPEA